MTPTRDEVYEAIRKSYCSEAATDAVMALLAPKPAPKRWIVEALDREGDEDGTLWGTTHRETHVRVVRELQVPSMETLLATFQSAIYDYPVNPRVAGIRAVLTACGLEVGKP
jgi:hypothetical protein